MGCKSSAKNTCFDFRLVPTATLTELVCSIYDREGKKYDKAAVAAIAQAGEGSVRDTVSIADRCLTLSSDTLTYDDVLQVLGVSSKNSIASLARAVLSNDTAAILADTNKLVTDGKDVARLNKDLSLYMRDLLTVKVCDNANAILMLPADVFESLSKVAETASVNKLLYAIEKLVELENGLKYALSPLMLFEATALKIASSTGDVDYDGLDRRLRRLEQQPQNISPENKSLYVVDKTDAKSIWRGVTMSIDGKGDPLLSGVWRDVKVELDGLGNFVVHCSEGAYWLIENKYKKRLQAEIAVFIDGNLIVKLDKTVSDGELDRQLSNLGTDVKID